MSRSSSLARFRKTLILFRESGVEGEVDEVDDLGGTMIPVGVDGRVI